MNHQIRKLLVVLAMMLVLLVSVSAFAAETHEGTGNGNNGPITVVVTTDGETITAIEVIEHSETAGLSDPAIAQIPEAIIAAGNTNVDTVAGATNTSKGIIEAVVNALAGEAAAEGEKPVGKEVSLPEWYTAKPRNEASAVTNAPVVKTLDNGIRVQETPTDDRGWNNAYMAADQRGCNSCHNLEDVVTGMDSYHGVVYYKYNNTMTVAQCLMCHSFYETPLRDTIHAIHENSAAFNSIGGSCNSCHYINAEGEFERWDYVKYDHLKGITSIAAEDVNYKITYDQDKLSDLDEMYYKSIKTLVMEPSDWLTDESQILPGLFEAWTITVNGDVDNPFTMTLPEMLETFPLTTETMSSQCCINGTGNSMIFQSEVTGILLKDIFDYAKVHDDVTTFDAACLDTYGTGGNQYPVDWSYVVNNGGMLVLYVNGQPLPAEQGYPCATWIARSSSGNCYKYVTELTVTKQENPANWVLSGYFVDPYTGKTFAKPNMGVLSTNNGTIFEAGKTVHLEGYADAWDEPIEYMEFSFDKGKTWIKVETPDNDSWRWTYWYLDFEAPSTGSYLLRMRATSRMESGELRTADINTDFLINVQ